MMKKLLVFVFCVACTSFTSINSDHLPQPRALRTLIIDPGHGGVDPGANGTNSTEAAVALEVAMKFGKALQDEFPDLKIIYTRTTNVLAGNFKTVNESLRYRADLANRSKGDLFISIHCNSAGKRAGGWYEKRVKGYTTKTTTTGKGKRKKKKTVKVPIYENVYVENKARGTESYIWAADRSGKKGENISTEGDGGENV